MTMTDKIDPEMTKALADILAAGFGEHAEKAIKKKLDEVNWAIEEHLMWNLKDNLAPFLAEHAADMAQKAVEQILEGNEDQMRRYLSCEKRGPDGQYIGWTGRSDAPSYGMRQREAHEWHPIIHGKLFEQGAVALRKKIVDAHADLLKDERIRDLEDQVKSLVEQNNRMEAEKNRMWERVRALEPA
jgi:hypothetical protein